MRMRWVTHLLPSSNTWYKLCGNTAVTRPLQSHLRSCLFYGSQRRCNFTKKYLESNMSGPKRGLSTMELLVCSLAMRRARGGQRRTRGA